jgi:hypothetical protein
VSINADQLGNDLLEVVKSTAADLGISLKDDLSETAKYTAERLRHISASVNDPNFTQIVRIESENIALNAARSAIVAGDKTDQAFKNVIQGALNIAARVLIAV